MSGDLLSHLPVIENEEEWNLDDYEPQTDTKFPPLKGGMALVKIIPGEFEVTDGEGNTTIKPIEFDHASRNKRLEWLDPRYVQVTFHLEIIGRIEVGSDKLEKVTSQDAGKKIQYQSLLTQPRRYDPLEGMADIMRLLLAVRSDKKNISIPTDWGIAMEEAIGKPFKARFRVRARCKTDTLKPNGKNLYINYPESKLDSDGEITVYKDTGEEVLGELDSTREVEVCRGYPEVMAYLQWEDAE